MRLGIMGLTKSFTITLGIIAFFLGFRFLFQLFGANPQTLLVSWVYEISKILLWPISGVFPQQEITGSSTFDIPALVALLGYTFLTHLLLSAISVLNRHGFAA